MDYSRSHLASREHHGVQMAKATMSQKHGKEDEQLLLHDWKGFRENVGDKVSRIEQNSINVAGAGCQSPMSHTVVAESTNKKPLKTFLRPSNTNTSIVTNDINSQQKLIQVRSEQKLNELH